MQKKCCFIVACVLAFSISASAQKINTDSLKLVSKISEYQLQRAKLMNMVEKATKDKQEAALQAQRSASENSEDAARLSSDPQNKKLARKADNAASDARRNSKRARAANDNLDNLNKNIGKLTEKIASEQSKLIKYTGVASVVPVPAPAAVIPAAHMDTTHRMPDSTHPQ
jgi:hypothetical protein